MNRFYETTRMCGLNEAVASVSCHDARLFKLALPDVGVSIWISCSGKRSGPTQRLLGFSSRARDSLLVVLSQQKTKVSVQWKAPGSAAEMSYLQQQDLVIRSTGYTIWVVLSNI